MPVHRGLAWAGLSGPVAFTGAWAAGAALRPGYRPTRETISRLAASGAPHREVMSAGMVALGVSLPVYAVALRRAVPGPAWWAAGATGVATLAVAALPLDRSAATDLLHAAAAGVGYLTLAAVPALAAGRLRRARHHRAALLSAVVATACGGCLAASLTTQATGAWQRAGLGAGHAWVAASALWMLAGGSGAVGA